jgi:hypothetical protein
MTALIINKLPPDLHWRHYTGDYAEILPYIRDAYDQVLNEFAARCPSEIHDELDSIVRELCDPEPERRCLVRRRGISTNRYILDRYVSKFNLLASKAELNYWGTTS